MSGAPQRVRIDRLGRRGEGLDAEGRLHVPYALPGDEVSVLPDGGHGDIIGLLTPGPDRIEAICPWFGRCGGCAVQGYAEARYRSWKRDLLVDALARAGAAIPVAALVDAHGEGRRRATFHARIEADGRTAVGYMQARSHSIVGIDRCPILAPGLDGALPAARAIAAALATAGKPLDIRCTATEEGLDVDLRGRGPLPDDERQRLVALATRHDLARLSNHGSIVLERRRPTINVATVRVELPPGCFLQATAAGEAAMAERVAAALRGARRVADLFCGLGTFALRLAHHAEVLAADTERQSLDSLERAARAATGLRRVRTEMRDLHNRPLTPEELTGFDAVCLDPPRAGAEAQMRAIAASDIATVMSVSCAVDSFSRDAAILLAAGFHCDEAAAIDQFRYSPHLEVVALFRRPRRRAPRRLLG